jgi:hypothetical protein
MAITFLIRRYTSVINAFDVTNSMIWDFFLVFDSHSAEQIFAVDRFFVYSVTSFQLRRLCSAEISY